MNAPTTEAEIRKEIRFYENQISFNEGRIAKLGSYNYKIQMFQNSLDLAIQNYGYSKEDFLAGGYRIGSDPLGGSMIDDILAAINEAMSKSNSLIDAVEAKITNYKTLISDYQASLATAKIRLANCTE